MALLLANSFHPILPDLDEQMNDFLQLLSVINHYRYHAMGNQLEKNVQVVIFPTVTSGWKCSYLNSAVLESYYSFLHVNISIYISSIYPIS